MKLFRMLVLASIASVSYVAQAQTYIGPFVPTQAENFDTIAPGSYAGFLGFGGFGAFTRIFGSGSLVVTNNPAVLPPVSAPNAMFGQGVDVSLRLQARVKRFGGWFRVAGLTTTPVTAVKFVFYQGLSVVGVSVGGPVNSLGYIWYGYDLGSLGGFDRVEIYGNGAAPGGIGMDNIGLQ